MSAPTFKIESPFVTKAKRLKAKATRAKRRMSYADIQQVRDFYNR